MTEDRKTELVKADRQRLAEALTLATFIVMALIALSTLFFVPPGDKTPIDNFTMPFVAAAAGVGYYLTRRGRHTAGILILLLAIGLVSVSYPFVADNIGWQTAIGMLLITTAIANAVFVEGVAGRISTAAFGLAIAIILVEAVTPGVVSNPVTNSSVIITSLLGFLYVGFILYRFRQYGLRTKLIIVFILVSVISVGATAFAINKLIVDQLNERKQQQLTGISTLMSTSIANELTAQIEILQAVALNDTIQNAFARQDATGDPAELERLDRQWLAADDSNPLVQAVLYNDAADHLRETRDQFPAHVEIFITDARGAIVAATNRTPGYYQADEEWWQSAFADGQGAIFIGQPVFDDNADIVSLQIAAPIVNKSNGEILGIIRSTLDLKILIPSFEFGRLGQTGQSEAYMPGDLELELRETEGALTLNIGTAPQDFTTAMRQNAGATFLDTLHDSVPVMAGISPVVASAAADPQIATAIQRMGWIVVTMQSRAEALQTAAYATRTAQLVGLASLVLASLFAVGMTQFLSNPIVQLTRVAEDISAGKFDVVAPVESQDEVGALASSFNRMTVQLRDTLVNLERLIAERTVDLEMSRRIAEARAVQALAIGDISKIIASERELNILLPLITRLVSERFGFYHVGIFLVDDARQYATLQAANSPGGQTMLQRGHKLKVGETGIVGAVAQTGVPRIALDVGQDAVFFNNPDLPATRSEAALPLKARDQIIGILDVQSERPGAFTPEDVNILSILGDQIATAIENTKLFEQTRQALEEARAAYQQTLREGWENIEGEEDVIGFHHSAGSGKKLTRPVSADEIDQAMYRGQTLVFHADGKTDNPILIAPIKIRGQIIGVMHVKSPSKDRPWTADEINLAEAVSDRLALALENARLIQESQRQVIKEQSISAITGKIGASINLKNVLQIAVEELGRSLPGAEVVVEFEQNEEKPSQP